MRMRTCKDAFAVAILEAPPPVGGRGPFSLNPLDWSRRGQPSRPLRRPTIARRAFLLALRLVARIAEVERGRQDRKAPRPGVKRGAELHVRTAASGVRFRSINATVRKRFLRRPTRR